MFNLFNNIGRKVKALAQYIVLIGVVASVGLGIFCLYIGIAGNYMYKPFITYGIVLLVIGSVSSLIQGIIIFGFGELIESVQAIKKQIAPGQFPQQPTIQGDNAPKNANQNK